MSDLAIAGFLMAFLIGLAITAPIWGVDSRDGVESDQPPGGSPGYTIATRAAGRLVAHGERGARRSAADGGVPPGRRGRETGRARAAAGGGLLGFMTQPARPLPARGRGGGFLLLQALRQQRDGGLDGADVHQPVPRRLTRWLRSIPWRGLRGTLARIVGTGRWMQDRGRTGRPPGGGPRGRRRTASRPPPDLAKVAAGGPPALADRRLGRRQRADRPPVGADRRALPGGADRRRATGPGRRGLPAEAGAGAGGRAGPCRAGPGARQVPRRCHPDRRAGRAGASSSPSTSSGRSRRPTPVRSAPRCWATCWPRRRRCWRRGSPRGWPTCRLPKCRSTTTASSWRPITPRTAPSWPRTGPLDPAWAVLCPIDAAEFFPPLARVGTSRWRSPASDGAYLGTVEASERYYRLGAGVLGALRRLQSSVFDETLPTVEGPALLAKIRRERRLTTTGEVIAYFDRALTARAEVVDRLREVERGAYPYGRYREDLTARGLTTAGNHDRRWSRLYGSVMKELAGELRAEGALRVGRAGGRQRVRPRARRAGARQRATWLARGRALLDQRLAATKCRSPPRADSTSTRRARSNSTSSWSQTRTSSTYAPASTSARSSVRLLEGRPPSSAGPARPGPGSPGTRPPRTRARSLTRGRQALRRSRCAASACGTRRS